MSNGRIIDLDKLLGPCPEDVDQEQAEYEAASRHFRQGGYSSFSFSESDFLLPSEHSASQLDKENHKRFKEGLASIR